MKQPKPALKKLLLLCAPIALTAVIIGSCKKDNHVTAPSAPNPAAVAEAKSWYEKAYPASTKLATQATAIDQDWSQGVKPDWNNGATYTRFDDDVVEMPVDASISGKLAIGLKEETTGMEYKQENSKSSFLLIKKLGNYHAYIMTIIGDPSYLKGDLTKLDKNKYNKRDSDFTGIVYYSTPKGAFVNAWTYQNGKVTAKISPSAASVDSSETNNGVKTDAIKTNLTGITVCYAWTQTTTYDGHSYPPVELDSYCVTTYAGDLGGSGSGGGGGGGSIGGTGGGGGTGSTGTTPPAPKDDPCAPKGGAVESIGKTVSVNGVQTNTYQPPATPVDPGGGFPPPDGNVPCATVVSGTSTSFPAPTIIDSLTARYPCAGRLLASLPTLPTNVATLIYQAFGSTNGPNIAFRVGDPAYFAANPSEDGYTQFDNHGTTNIYINPSVLANASNEYLLVTYYHEALHAYLDNERVTLGSAGFAAKYPAIHVVERPNYSPNVTKQNNYYFDDGTTIAPVDPKHRTMADYFTQQLRDAITTYNPSFPVDRATALARGGIFLNDTNNKYFNDSEKDVRKGNSVGTRCTP